MAQVACETRIRGIDQQVGQNPTTVLQSLSHRRRSEGFNPQSVRRRIDDASGQPARARNRAPSRLNAADKFCRRRAAFKRRTGPALRCGVNRHGEPQFVDHRWGYSERRVRAVCIGGSGAIGSDAGNGRPWSGVGLKKQFGRLLVGLSIGRSRCVLTFWHKPRLSQRITGVGHETGRWGAVLR